MKKNKFRLLTSLLNKDGDYPEKKSFTSSEEQAEYDKLNFLWNRCFPPETEETDIWEKVQNKINIDSTSVSHIKKSSKSIQWLSIVRYSLAAASVAALIEITCFLPMNDEERCDLDKIARNPQTEIPQDIKEATLVVSDQKKIELDNNVQITYSATGQIRVNFNRPTEDDSKEIYSQIIVPKGKRLQVVLADNSKVWINSGGKIIYPRIFEGKYREIYVEGEVYLKATHDVSKPFIVDTSGFEVSVLSTSFSISAYKSQEEATVVLVEGLVNVEDQRSCYIKMAPNEKVELSQAGITGKAEIDTRDYISWIARIQTLQGESLK